MFTKVLTDKQIVRSAAIIINLDAFAPAGARGIRRQMGLLPKPTPNSTRNLHLIFWENSTKNHAVFSFVHGHPSDQPHWNDTLIAAFRKAERDPNRAKLKWLIKDAMVLTTQKRRHRAK